MTKTPRNFRPRARAAALLALTLPLGACMTGGGTAALSSAKETAPVETLLARGDAARELGAVEDALMHYRLVLEREPANPKARLGVGEIYLSLREAKKAREAFDALTGEPAVRARALQGNGLTLAMDGQADAAEAPLRAAVAEDPALWRAWNALGHIHDRRKEWSEARACYEKALEGAPRSASVHNNLGFSLILAGQPEQAEMHLVKAIEIERDNKLARSNLRLALAWQGRYQEALAGAQSEELAAALNNVGYVAMLRGDYVAAEAYLTRAMEASPSHYEAAMRNLNHLTARAGRIADAPAKPAVTLAKK